MPSQDPCMAHAELFAAQLHPFNSCAILFTLSQYNLPFSIMGVGCLTVVNVGLLQFPFAATNILQLPSYNSA